MEAQQVGQNIHLAAKGTQILAHQIEADIPSCPDGQTQRKQFARVEIRLDAEGWEPAETEAAADRIDCGLNRCDLKRALSQYTRLVLECAGGRSFDGNQSVLHEISPAELVLDSVQRVTAARDGDHPDCEDGCREEFARNESRDAKLRVMGGKLGIGGEKRALAESWLNIWEEADKLGQRREEAVIGVDAVYREPDFGLATQGQGTGSLFELMETRQVWLNLREQHTPHLGEVRATPLDLEKSDTKLFLQASDRVADGGLGAIELFGGRRETA